jgi:hypothetical protein
MRFTIRDVLWLTVVVAMGVGWFRQNSICESEKAKLVEQHEAALANERRLGELRAREAVEEVVARYRQPRGIPAEQIRAIRSGLRDDEPTPVLPLNK